MNVIQYSKPLPVSDGETEAFWEGCRTHRLLIQRCPHCGYYCMPPYPMCPRCNSMDREWSPVKGKGYIYSWIVVHKATHPDFIIDAPYAVALVELDEQEDLRIPGYLVDWDSGDIQIGMQVEVVFDDVTEQITLPKWMKIKDS